nr:hypothetical protein [uncultured Porphyromonas sp.]
MNKQRELPQAEDSRQHYSVPEDYFSLLEERILASIPEEEPEAEEPKPSLWIRLRPIVYLAAVFVSLNLLIRALAPQQEQPTSSTLASAEVNDEDYRSYYSEYGAHASYLEAMDAVYSEEASDLPLEE